MPRNRFVVARHKSFASSQHHLPTTHVDLRQGQTTSLRFADTLTNGIKSNELLVFETCAHAPIYQSVAEFNEKTLTS